MRVKEHEAFQTEGFYFVLSQWFNRVRTCSALEESSMDPKFLQTGKGHLCDRKRRKSDVASEAIRASVRRASH